MASIAGACVLSRPPPANGLLDFSEAAAARNVADRGQVLTPKSASSPTRRCLDLRDFDARSKRNLSSIRKAARHLVDDGELIFIMLHDFHKATSAERLNRALFKHCTISHVIDPAFGLEPGRVDHLSVEGTKAAGAGVTAR